MEVLKKYTGFTPEHWGCTFLYRKPEDCSLHRHEISKHSHFLLTVIIQNIQEKLYTV
jgi:hypothetical protein